MICKQLKETPKDTITDILIKDDILYISSWDCSICAYDLRTGQLLYKMQNDCPILKLNWKDGLLYSDTNGFVNFGTKLAHNSKINFNSKGIFILENFNNSLIISGLSKKLCVFHDYGVSDVYFLKQKAYSSILSDNSIFINFGNTIGFFDMRNFKQYKEIKCKSFVRTIYKKNDNIYLGDVNGKLKVYDTISGESIIYNAHFKSDKQKKIVYPINDILYLSNLYTCGSDGVVNKWNFNDKTTFRPVFKSNSGVLKIASYKDKIIAACGYNYEIGPGDTSKNNVYIFTM